MPPACVLPPHSLLPPAFLSLWRGAHGPLEVCSPLLILPQKSPRVSEGPHALLWGTAQVLSNKPVTTPCLLQTASFSNWEGQDLKGQYSAENDWAGRSVISGPLSACWLKWMQERAGRETSKILQAFPEDGLKPLSEWKTTTSVRRRTCPCWLWLCGSALKTTLLAGGTRGVSPIPLLIYLNTMPLSFSPLFHFGKYVGSLQAKSIRPVAAAAVLFDQILKYSLPTLRSFYLMIF